MYDIEILKKLEKRNYLNYVKRINIEINNGILVNILNLAE